MFTTFLAAAPHYLIPFVVVIGVVVFVHEFGHYWVARRCGVKIEAFSIGFGHEIFGWNDKHGTRWKVAWLPLGGYVKMYGDAGAASNPSSTVHGMTDEQKRVSFYHQKVARRMAVVVAGPAFNYIFAILVLAVLFMTEGQPYSPPDVSSVIEASAAAKAGILKGDHITRVDNETVNRFEDIKRIIALNAGTPVPIELTRDGQPLNFTVTPDIVNQTDRFGGEHKLGRIGIAADQLQYQKWSPPKAVAQAAVETWELTTGTLKAMGQMVMGTRTTDELGGPLRIAEMSGQVAKDGIVSLIWFMAVISINLGLINLFPVPLLDGGHLVFYGVEWLRGRPLGEKVQDAGLRVGMALVFSLMIFATWNDLVHLKVISYIKGLFS